MLFLIPALPIAIWVAYSDMSRMKIPNIAVLALAGSFIVLGGGLVLAGMMPWQIFMMRIGAGLLILAIGFLMNQLRLIGAGDAKYAAAMAPYFATQDVGLVLMILSASLLLAFATHRTARAIPAVRGATDHWESWTHKKFPMGLALSMTLVAYLILPLFFM